VTVELPDAARPRHVLFLCVANSARSQMAEGIARNLAPPDIRMSSAGSQPATVRPEAIAVLNEIGIDISQHRSKRLDAIDLESVDTVVTLCADEICPVFPGPVRRFHWSLDDPAAADGDAQARLDAFRRTRDELRRLLAELFSRLQQRPEPGRGGTSDP
jgi:arsenate reductase